MTPARRSNILIITLVVVLLGSEIGFIFLRRSPAGAPPQLVERASRFQNIDLKVLQDARFRKLKTGAISSVHVGETGRTNPFEPTAEPIAPPPPPPEVASSTSSTP